eukprot:TRINITY_DN123673_c0_g1_i1.p1 TRINITY_DN123673_c0_g1~~TRINITY_DN123673_c0_g1_i1.p1  ORF type:complete len:735 (-),score=223.05 TRINITY_DN123673_c0_g1_i1:210-2414(-)
MGCEVSKLCKDSQNKQIDDVGEYGAMTVSDTSRGTRIRAASLEGSPTAAAKAAEANKTCSTSAEGEKLANKAASEEKAPSEEPSEFPQDSKDGSSPRLTAEALMQVEKLAAEKQAKDQAAAAAAAAAEAAAAAQPSPRRDRRAYSEVGAESVEVRSDCGDSVLSGDSRLSDCEDGSGSESGQSVASRMSTRGGKRRGAKKLALTATMGFMPSQALQLIIDNPDRDVTHNYDFKSGPEAKLGAGNFGSVRIGKVKATGATRAVKAIGKADMKTKINILKTEIEITKLVDHPNLIKLFETYETDDKLFLVLELAQGGNLFNLVDKSCKSDSTVGGFSDRQGAIAMQQVLRAIYYMHKNFVIHRDLKPENVLSSAKVTIERTVLKVTDFGLSCFFKEGQMFKTKAGTPTYMAPEVLMENYDHRCDIWSAGVMLYFCMCGSLPFTGKDKEAVYKRIKALAFKYDNPAWGTRSDEAINLINAMITPLKKRISIESALTDSFFKKYHPPIRQIDIPSDILDNLRTYRDLNKLKRASLTVLASMLPEAQIKTSKEIFLSCDVDGDGTVSVDELRSRLTAQRERQKEEKKKDSALDRALAKVEANDSSLSDFTFTEFLAATIDRKTLNSEKILKAAFSSFDKNGDGNISMTELAGGRLLGHLSLEELSQIFDELDSNGDCFIDFDEFKAMMMPDEPTSPKAVRGGGGGFTPTNSKRGASGTSTPTGSTSLEQAKAALAKASR